MLNVDHYPRTFQLNAYRLFTRVIAPVMQNMPVHLSDAFLDNCIMQVDNYTANEANKVYALVLIALFERQFRLWASHILEGKSDINVERDAFLEVFDAATAEAGIDVKTEGVRATIEEGFEVGNVVRHGEGRALTRLRELAPGLIDRTKRDYIDILFPTSPDSEWLRIRPADVERYIKAIIHFWGLADREPGAITTMTFQTPTL